MTRFIVFLVSIYYLPITLNLLGIIPFDYRFHTLIAMFLITIIYAIWRRYKPSELGLRTDNLKSATIWNLAITACFLVIMILGYVFGLIREPTVPEWQLFVLFYILVSSPAQEYLFRGLIFHEMELVNLSPILKVLISAITYCYAHIIYSDVLTLVLTALLGLVWGTIYLFHQNLWAISISHALLGIVAIYVGLI